MSKKMTDISVAYAGYLKDSLKLQQSASGGAATALAGSIIRTGGSVFGVTYKSDWKSAEYTIAKTFDELDKLKGSKYIEVSKQVYMNGKYISIYQAVTEMLKIGKPVLFFGLGCTVAALKTYLNANQADTSLLYTVSLICHGQPPARIAEQYITELEARFSSKICSFNTRYKRKKWKPVYIRAEFENGIVYEIPLYCSDFGYAFSIYSREVCYQCKYRDTNHPSDVVIGDYWGIQKEMPGYNQNGVSLIIPQTKKGLSLLSMINETEFQLYETDFQYAMDHNPMYWKSKNKHKEYELFKKIYVEKGLHKAVLQCQGPVPYFLRKIRNAILYERVKFKS